MGKNLLIKMTERSKFNLLKNIYYDLNSPATYAGVEKVYTEAKKLNPKIELEDVKQFLESQSTYTLYRPVRRKYKRLATVPTGFHSHWQCDLCIFDTLYKNNDGFKYLLVCIDVLSRKIFVSPTKSKASKDMIDAFEKIFKKSQVKPHKIYSDRGVEFQAARMLEYFKEKDIIKLVVYSDDIHCGVVERANRTIKDKIYRYFHNRKNHRWVDVVDKIADSINNSANRTTGIAPNDVNYNNAQQILQKVYKNAYTPTTKPKFSAGDLVRVSKNKGKFGKSYHPNFTSEIFKIKQVKHSNPIHYKIEDLKGEDILGVWYDSDLSIVRGNQIGQGAIMIKPIMWEKL